MNLIGGEVFLHPDWQEITAALTERGMAVRILTNGFAMTPEIPEDWNAPGIESAAMSLGRPERVHDRCRQAGSYRQALTADYIESSLCVKDVE